MTVQEIAPFPAKRLKYVVSLRRSRVDGREDDRPYIGLENIESWTGKRLVDSVALNEKPSPTAIERTSLANTFEPGDVLFGKLRPYLAKVWVAEFSGRSTTELLVMRPVEAELRFLRYVCLWREFIDAVDASTFGSKMPRADWDFIGDMPIPVPDWPKQRVIADYLDRETARLDALVAAKERVLGLLAEKRRALITRAVTRGLDPNVTLRDSGIPWLGTIPAHWKTPPVYARFEVQLGKMLDEKRTKGTHLAPYLRNIDVQWGVINTTDLPEMDFDEDDRCRYALRVGDILVCEGGEVGRCALWNGTHPECYYQKALHRLRPTGDEDEPAFSVLVMRAIVDSGQFALQSSAATIQHLPAEKLRVVRYPAPPLDEQRAIVAHVGLETGKLHALSVATERTIALLGERRAALIAAAVTGQLEVL